MKGMSRKKFSRAAEKVLAASPDPFPKSRTVITTFVVNRFSAWLLLARILNSRYSWSPKAVPTMVLFATPIFDWAYDYFWLCVGAYGSVWSLAG